MDANVWGRVKEVLDDVLEIEHSSRAEYIETLGLSNEVRTEVLSLLAFEQDANEMMQQPAVEFVKDLVDDDKSGAIGETFGPYRIVSELGYGGMGAVYLAERVDGKFDQKAALKLLKREMNTSALRRHFEQEREILAALDHPNIARLLDAGTTDDKIPFIAMEYVDGVPIDEYCNAEGLGLNARLELFRKVCDAVDFAHRNLIVHRDLKPSNILVAKDGVPKLLDFGISKIISDEIAQANSATITRMGVMTPSYASPEQLRGESVTTLSDVYSLGVILFELLSGHRPFEDREGDIRDIYSAVLERDPVPPSSVVDTAKGSTGQKHQNNKGSEAKTDKLPDRRTRPEPVPLSSSSIRGDLDNIVLKALRKEPERRYRSAASLSDDIHRHLQGLTVTARPNTFGYRTSKFVKRNLYGVGAAAVITLAVVAGIATTLWQARAAQTERSKAEKRFNDVRKLANSYLFDVYPEIENLEGSLKAREIIITNALEYLDSLSSEASGDLSLQSELATAYEKIGEVQGAMSGPSLGNIQAGLDSYTKAARLREMVYSARPSDLEAKEKLANNYYVTARTLWNNSQTKEAEESFIRALGLRRELVSDDPASAEYQNRLAVLLIDYGAIPVFNSQTEKAVGLFNEAFAIIERLRAGDPGNADFKKSQTRLLRIMSKAKGSLGDYDGAVSGFALAIDVSNELAKEFPKDFRVQRSVWLTHSMLCELYIDKGDGANAAESCAPTIKFPETAHLKEPENGVVTYDLAISHFNTARAHRLSKNFSETIIQAEKASAVMSKLSAKNPDVMEYKRNLAIYDTERARAQIELGRYTDAAVALQKVLEIMMPIAEADQATTTYRYDVAIAHRLMAKSYFKTGSNSKALESLEKAIAIIQQLSDSRSLRETDKDLLNELAAERALYSAQ